MYRPRSPSTSNAWSKPSSVLPSFASARTKTRPSSRICCLRSSPTPSTLARSSWAKYWSSSAVFSSTNVERIQASNASTFLLIRGAMLTARVEEASLSSRSAEAQSTMKATPTTTSTAPATRPGLTRSPSVRPASSATIRTLVSRTAATDAAGARWSAARTSA